VERRINRVIDPLLSPKRARWVFAVGIFLFAVLSNALYDVLLQAIGSPATIGGLSILAILLVVLANQGQEHLRRRKLVPVGPRPRRGLVVLVSQGVLRGSVTEMAIHYHYRGEGDERPTGTLQHCWLLTSPDAPVKKEPDKPNPMPPGDQVSAWTNANYLAQKYAGLVDMHIVQVDFNDPVDGFEKVEDVLAEARRRGLGRDEMAVNFKGGTKEVSVGMVLAATTQGYYVETLLPSARDADGYRLVGSKSEPVVLDLRPILPSEVE